MLYLDSFSLPNEREETKFILSNDHRLDMACYIKNVYPFKLFPQKGLEKFTFEPVTLLYGGNGSGKSTILNIIAQKLNLEHDSPFNNTPFFEVYLDFCKYGLASQQKKIPQESRIITSDDVFDFLLNLRALNDGIDRSREKLFEEYRQMREETFTLRSLSDYEELKRHNEAKSRNKTKSQYISRRLPGSLTGKSNGESAFGYFTEKIRENALYLLDEPENSLSAAMQFHLAKFLEDSARFYGCQFIISTHSPFLLSMKGARIYDLDAKPVSVTKWTELENVRLYYAFFKEHEKAFGENPPKLSTFSTATD